MKTLIIAEAGVNHNGDIEMAKKLVDVAADAGADLVKFQTFNADRLVTRSAPKAKYQLLARESTETQHAMLQKLELDEAGHQALIAHCASRDIRFFSTGFDIQSINLLVGFGQELFKIPSGEITNLPYLRHIGQLGKAVILSTGMSDMDEIAAAIKVLEVSGTSRDKISVLHCTSAYPAPMHDVNLRALQSIQNAFDVAVGYSDHTIGIEIPIAAVALGATIIEKHFTINRNLPGPDHKVSLEPNELKSMISGIRNIELALGDGMKRPMPSELDNRSIVRKSIMASQNIKLGEDDTHENLTTKRPGTGVSPMRWDEYLGQKASRGYTEDELIERIRLEEDRRFYKYIISEENGKKALGV
jgi:N,N'-diacetyllegionaminate synthase